MKKQTNNGTFFRRCPVCRTISGFCLAKEIVEKNEKHYCQACGKESKLSDWGKSTEGDYLRFENSELVKNKRRK